MFSCDNAEQKQRERKSRAKEKKRFNNYSIMHDIYREPKSRTAARWKDTRIRAQAKLNARTRPHEELDALIQRVAPLTYEPYHLVIHYILYLIIEAEDLLAGSGEYITFRTLKDNKRVYNLDQLIQYIQSILEDVIGYKEAQRLKANTPNWQLKRDISAKIMRAERLQKACQQSVAPPSPHAEDGSLKSSHPVYEKRRISPSVGDELNRARNSPPPAEDRSSKSSHLGTDGTKDVTAPVLPSSTSGTATPERWTKHRVHPVHDPGRRISASMGDQFGCARYSSNNLETDFVVMTSHRSLQRRQARRVKDGRVKRVDKSYNRNYSLTTIRHTRIAVSASLDTVIEETISATAESSTTTSALVLSDSGTKDVQEVAAPASYTKTDAVETPPAVQEFTAPSSDSSILGTELMAMMVHLEKRLQRIEASSIHLMDSVVPALLAAANRSLPVVAPKQRNRQPCVISRPPTLNEQMISNWERNCTLPERYHQLCEEASVFITAAQHTAARSIQRVVRGGLARLSFCRLGNAVILLQTTARGKFAKAKLQCLRLLKQVKATEQSKASLAEETLGSGGTPSQQVPKVASKVSQDLSLVKSSPKEVSLDPLSSAQGKPE